MTWDLAPAYLTATVMGGAGSYQVGVYERPPERSATEGATVTQPVRLLLPSGEVLAPPLRLMVDGMQLRVLGTQMAPIPGAPSLVSCVLVNPNLPDSGHLIRMGDPVDNPATNTLDRAETVIWSGDVHVSSGLPASVVTAGESLPLDKATIGLPITAPYEADLLLRVTSSTQPAVLGDYKLSGELLDSDATVRRVIGYRP